MELGMIDETLLFIVSTMQLWHLNSGVDIMGLATRCSHNGFCFLEALKFLGAYIGRFSLRPQFEMRHGT
jgi:hypothetical protein